MMIHRFEEAKEAPSIGSTQSCKKPHEFTNPAEYRKPHHSAIFFLSPLAEVECLPVLAAFQTSARLYQTLGGLYRELHGTDVRRWASFFSDGMETDDFQEALDELRTLSLCYKKGSLDESSDGDDTD